MTKEAETDIKERRKADALALAELIHDIYIEKKQQEMRSDEVL